MTFERSPQGQANRALFYHVDWIIYSEGGASDQETMRSFDMLFWTAVFRSLGGGQSFRVIPKGGKRQVKLHAAQVCDQEVDRVIVVMDKDYDEVFENIIDHPRVIYTCGYSIENDIFEESNLADILDSLCPEHIDLDEVRVSIAKWIRNFLAIFRWPIKLDLFAYRNGVCGFDRSRPQKYFESNSYGSGPIACRDRVIAEAIRISGECNTKSLNVNNFPKVAAMNIIGHIWEVFSFRAITSLQCTHSKNSKITYEYLRVFAISQFENRLMRQSPDDEVAIWYKSKVRSAFAMQ